MIKFGSVSKIADTDYGKGAVLLPTSLSSSSWTFINHTADFELENCPLSSDLYFPLANLAGMKSAITPLLHGDAKLGHNQFLLAPVCTVDLHNARSARNFWLYIHGSGPWSVAGNSASQTMKRFGSDAEKVKLEAGLLWQKVTRVNREQGIRVEVVSFVPTTEDKVELMQVTITNIKDAAVTITPTAAIPLYGRSADNLRDHRQVTSLLNRTFTLPSGVILQPTFCFDERGHQLNRMIYGVLGADGGGGKPVGFFPITEDFIGEDGNLEWPEAVVTNRRDCCGAGERLDGFESVGALRFQDQHLAPGDSHSYIIAMVIGEADQDLEGIAGRYCSSKAFERYFLENQQFWNKRLSALSFQTGDCQMNSWLTWVGVQPILRRIYGCSFLPHHDYGRGGRGWRDLWQDCLGLLLQDPGEVRELLLNNFAGIRLDGTNATIIGDLPGEFIADRNNISRVWMDHGAWPWFTTKLYLDQSGDYDFLLAQQLYFQDRLVCRGTMVDPEWNPDWGCWLREKEGPVYRGTVLEHLLIQHLTAFFNVGVHNNMRLENADWNDALDMAAEQGESVAFSAFYSYNLLEMAQLLLNWQAEEKVESIELLAELRIFLDTFEEAIDYDSVEAKRNLLQRYCSSCQAGISGQKFRVKLVNLAADLRRKGEWLANHIRNTEWIGDAAGFHWFNGYYNNEAQRVEGEFPTGVRITLTGQVFTVMSGVATPEQVEMIIKTVNHYLKDPIMGSYRLNTNFGGVQPNLGRAFGFAYGHKENGAVFCHMAVMYANALYRRGFVEAGHEVLSSLYRMAVNFETSRIYPGIPEYFNQKGRGMYHYLTGAASWYLFTMLTEVYGVKGFGGDLAFEPKLLLEQFDQLGNTTVRTNFADRELLIKIENPKKLEYGQYQIQNVRLDGYPVDHCCRGNTAIIPRPVIEALSSDLHQVLVLLG